MRSEYVACLQESIHIFKVVKYGYGVECTEGAVGIINRMHVVIHSISVRTMMWRHFKNKREIHKMSTHYRKQLQ